MPHPLSPNKWYMFHCWQKYWKYENVEGRNEKASFFLVKCNFFSYSNNGWHIWFFLRIKSHFEVCTLRTAPKNWNFLKADALWKVIGSISRTKCTWLGLNYSPLTFSLITLSRSQRFYRRRETESLWNFCVNEYVGGASAFFCKNLEIVLFNVLYDFHGRNYLLCLVYFLIGITR